jgi:hypothetical protein
MASPVRMGPHSIEKRVAGSADEVAEKYDRIHELGKKFGFIAPAAISVDLIQNIVVMERIHAVRSIRDVYLGFMSGSVKSEMALEIFGQAGRVLAVLHSNLQHRNSPKWYPQPCFTKAVKRYGFNEIRRPSSEEVELHCDYGFANVLFRQPAGGKIEIVVIDPCQDDYSTLHDWCRGPQYVDIGKMLLSLEGKVSLGNQILLRRGKIRALQERFLKGYASVRRVSYEPGFAYAYGLGECYFARRYPVIRRLGMNVVYNTLVKGNFPLAVKMKGMAPHNSA